MAHTLSGAQCPVAHTLSGAQCPVDLALTPHISVEGVVTMQNLVNARFCPVFALQKLSLVMTLCSNEASQSPPLELLNELKSVAH